MKNKFIIIVAVFIAAFCYYLIVPFNSPVPAPEPQPELLKALNDPGATPRMVYDSLIRLGQHGSGLEICKTYLETKEDILIRQGAALCLGYLNGSESYEPLKKALSDNEPLVRRSALEGLGKGGGEARKKLIMNHLKKEGLSESEKTAGYISVVKLSRGTKVNEEALKYLIGTLDREDLNFQRNVLLQLTHLLPNDPDVLGILRHKVFADEDTEVVATGIRHLAAVRDEWVANQFSRFANHPQSQVRQAFAGSMHLLCPDKLWDFLFYMAINEKDPRTLDVILGEPLLIKGEEAKAFYQRLKRESEINDKALDQLLAKVDAKPQVNHCGLQ